jgi:hypothetical protein
MLFKICKYLYFSNKKKEANIIKDIVNKKNSNNKEKLNYILEISKNIELEIPADILSNKKNEMKKTNNKNKNEKILNLDKNKEKNINISKRKNSNIIKEKIIVNKDNQINKKEEEKKYKENINPNANIYSNKIKEESDYQGCKYFIEAMEKIEKRKSNNTNFESPVKAKINPLLDDKVELRSYYKRKQEREYIEKIFLESRIDPDMKYLLKIK